jgi:hypothetical protein
MIILFYISRHGSRFSQMVGRLRESLAKTKARERKAVHWQNLDTNCRGRANKSLMAYARIVSIFARRTA